MKRRRIDLIAVVGLTLLGMKLFGSLHFTDAMTERWVLLVARVGVRGDEDVENVYLPVTAVLSLILSMATVTLARSGFGCSK